MQNARLFTQVERQREYLESLVAISPAAVVVMDTHEIVTDWNPAAADLFGHSAEEAVGRHIDDLVFGETGREEGREITAEAMRTGRAQRFANRRRSDGTLVDVELMLVPLTAEGTHVGFLRLDRDVVEGSLDIVAPRAWEKELELGCLIDDAAPAGIVGDEARIRQVLLNLLSNAVKFTERGEVMVLVSAEETGAGSHRIELAVRD